MTPLPTGMVTELVPQQDSSHTTLAPESGRAAALLIKETDRGDCGASEDDQLSRVWSKDLPVTLSMVCSWCARCPCCNHLAIHTQAQAASAGADPTVIVAWFRYRQLFKTIVLFCQAYLCSEGLVKLAATVLSCLNMGSP